MNYLKALVKSQSVISTILRCVAVLSVVIVAISVFWLDDNFLDVEDFSSWLSLLIRTFLSSVVIYGFATIIDAAYLYVKKNAPEEEVDDYDSIINSR